MPTPTLKRASYLSLCRPLALASAAIVFVTCVSGAEQNPAKDAGPQPSSVPAAPTEKKAPAPTQSNPSEAAIRATAEAFIKAFNAGDAKAVANLWTPNGTVADEQGNVVKGRKAIEEEYAALFKAHPTARMQVAIKSIDFPTPTTAVEDGMTQVVTTDNDPPAASRYTVVHVQEDGKWLMAGVRESTIPVASNFAQLQELGWLVRLGIKVERHHRPLANSLDRQQELSAEKLFRSPRWAARRLGDADRRLGPAQRTHRLVDLRLVGRARHRGLERRAGRLGNRFGRPDGRRSPDVVEGPLDSGARREQRLRLALDGSEARGHENPGCS